MQTTLLHLLCTVQFKVRFKSRGQNNMKELTIGEVAEYAGIQPSAIRYYESMGLLPRPKRIHGHRRYDRTVLKRLGLIQLVRQAGFGIRELQVLFGDAGTGVPATSEWKTLAAEKIAEMDALIRQTQATKAWLEAALHTDCQGVDDCIRITFDESGSPVSVTLTCEMRHYTNDAADGKPMTLLTMQITQES
jgi:MerR family transcriptional regulator, redox-sensitive transcriptional activator SoxR